MNNSQLAQDFAISLSQDEQVDLTPTLKEREAKLVRIIDAVRELKSSNAWRTLKTEEFDAKTDSLERDLRTEAKKDQPDSNKLNRIAGQLKWAERYSNLDKFEQSYLVELKALKQKIYA